jgi:hypothetical protein
MKRRLSSGLALKGGQPSKMLLEENDDENEKRNRLRERQLNIEVSDSPQKKKLAKVCADELMRA